MNELIQALQSLMPSDLTGAVLRYVFPVLALIVLVRCARSLLWFRKEPEIWAVLRFATDSPAVLPRHTPVAKFPHQSSAVKKHSSLLPFEGARKV